MEKETYESAVGRLNEIVQKLETPNVSLADTIALYKEGEKLIKFCEEQLSKADSEIKMVKIEDGKAVLVDFEAEGED